ncbi:PREDICTED: uncharacterized protein LOC105143140 isoform X2 [Acromyrmex echinatior]|nr:PREDICTED: uncharacterized protein LOC105143140 isoform X2 [Acromyrmex echinatior]
MLIETDNSDKSDDDLLNSSKSVVTSKQSTIPPFSSKIISPSPIESSENSNKKSLKTDIAKSTIKTQCIVSTSVSYPLPSEGIYCESASYESDILNKNNTAVPENSNKSIVTPGTSLNMTPETLDQVDQLESSGNSSLGFFKNLFTSPKKRSLNVTPKTPTFEQSQIINKFETDTPITPKTRNSCSPLSPGPRASSPFIFTFSPTKIKKSHKKTQDFSEHTIKEFSTQNIFQEMLVNLKDCKTLLQENILYQRMIYSLEREKKQHLKNLEDLMKSNFDTVHKIQRQIYTMRGQYTELSSHLRNISIQKSKSKNISSV